MTETSPTPTNNTPGPAIVAGPFDDLRYPDLRFLQEAARSGPLHVLLYSDALCHEVTGVAPKFPAAERQYFLDALRYVTAVHVIDRLATTAELANLCGATPETWVIRAGDTDAAHQAAADSGLACRTVADVELTGYPEPPAPAPSGRKKVLVTGCYDWFHTGHIRFFEECSELGDLTVVVGHDANIRLLKGEGHPMFDENQRRYIVGSIRFVTAALVSTGSGWMDAAPQIAEVQPDIYAVNEDGDRPEKRQFCADHHLEYVVLKRLPKPGLPRRESTHLRGF